MSSINVCSSSGDDSDGSELDVEITQDAPRQLLPSCSSSKTSPLPTVSAAPVLAVDAPAKDPPGQSKEPLPRGSQQQSMLSFMPDATIAPRRPTAATAKPKRKQQQEIEAAAANPTAPARAAHIDKLRLVRLNKDRRKGKASDGGSEEEEKEEVEVVGTKRKSTKTVVAKKALRARVSSWERVKQFPNQTLGVVNGSVYCQACQKGLTGDKKSSVDNHCKGDVDLKAVADFARKKQAKQVILPS